MKRIAILIGIATLSLAALSACGGDDDTAGAQPDLPQGGEPVELDPADFTADITNEYWPMAPGARWTYAETGPDGGELQVVVTVSSETREIANGITARVVRDTVTQDGKLIEDTFDWYAQDSEGNIWYMGEDTAEFENGQLATTEGSWEAGVDGALPGIIMPADPTDGMAYRQEYYAGEAEDGGEVITRAGHLSLDSGEYGDVVVTKDTTALEPDVLEFKFYAPDVGPVLAIGVSGGDREELIGVETVDAGTAAAAGTTPLGEAY